MRILPCGDRAVLVEFEDSSDVLRMRSALSTEPPTGVRETVPALRTLLVRYDPLHTTAPQLVSELETRRARPVDHVPPPGVRPDLVIDVRYDGADLADVAEQAKLGVRDVVRRHTDATYTVAFCGFAPGFAYLTGSHPDLHLPRHSTPRTRIPAGAVAIAGEFTGIYPRPSPGGWRIIGHTEFSTWNIRQSPPTPMIPGRRVRFAEI